MLKHSLAGSALLIALLAADLKVAAQQLDPVIKKSGEINQSAAASQEKVDQISGQIEDKLRQFKSLTKETERLDIYNRQLARQLTNQRLKMDQLNQSISDVSVLERQITPLVLRMIDGLVEFVKLDLPFLADQRLAKIQLLRNMMDSAELSVSDKFRRVLEAYQNEMDYGRNIETYTASLALENNEQDVEFLRIGRLALIFQTRDRKTMGTWNKSTRQWDLLDDSFRSQINKGIRMAREQMAPDLLTIPVYTAK